MGRAFEYRKKAKEKRWGMMATTFTKIGKIIAMAAKAGGGDPSSNPRLRLAMQNAKGVGMPKDRVEAAIKRATNKDEVDYSESLYEGYGPNGVAIMIECATDNPTRTVANLRVYLSKSGGSLGNTGSITFMFDRKSSFRITKDNHNVEDLELELIDYGLEEIDEDGDEIVIYAGYSDFAQMQKALEDKGVNIINSELTRIPNMFTKVSAIDAEKIEALIEKIEEDDDVQAVYSNMEVGD